MRPVIKTVPTFLETVNKAEGFVFFLSAESYKLFDSIPLEWKVFCKQKAEKEKFEGKTTQFLHIELFQKNKHIHIFCVGIGKKKEVSIRVLRDQTGTVSRFCRTSSIRSLSIQVPQISSLKKEDICTSLVEGALLGNYVFDVFKGEEEKRKHKAIETIYLCEMTDEIVEAALLKGQITSESVCLTRDLINSPASHVHPETLAKKAFEIEKASNGKVKVEILDEIECKKLGMEAFLGVAKGSDHKPAFIILKYKSGHATKDKGKKIALIGKSITFDSGGLSLKPSEAMMDMKIDMAGGATVLGVFTYLALYKPELVYSEAVGILPACENMPSGKAIRPGDIVTAVNGKTIEVLNTDAEGRLTLADALSYTEKYLHADVIIDLATLTGACMVALGSDMSGLFSNNEKLTEVFKKSAQYAGDDLWELPLYKGYTEKIKSTIADLKNVGGGRYAGAITAALFLQEFVKKARWMHIDIAGPAYREDKPVGVLPRGATGWGVLSIIHFLEHHNSL